MIRRLTIAALPLLLVAAPLRAQPSLAVYQGYLTGADGEPVDGLVDMFFRVYASETGGTPVWSHTEPDVEVARGSFAVELPVDAGQIAQPDLWLALAVESQSNELAPRQHVASMPWALLCGDALGLGGSAAASFQRAIAASCPPGSAVRAILETGLVDCEPDDSQGVGAVTAGLGLAGSATTGDVTLDVGAGAGIQIVGDAVGLAFGGSGTLDEAARADHGHTDYIPQGTALTCSGTDKVVSISPTSGDVECGPDADTTYGVVLGGNLALQPGNVLETQPDITVNGSVMAAEFLFAAPKTGYFALHPADFDPVDSGDPDYFASRPGPGFVQSSADTTVLAPLHLPDGATVTGWEFTYRSVSNLDQLCCALRSLDMTSSPVVSEFSCTDPTVCCATTSTGGAPVTIGVPLTVGDYPSFDRVDNQAIAYQAECFFVDDVPFQDIQLIGMRAFYTYDRL